MRLATSIYLRWAVFRAEYNSTLLNPYVNTMFIIPIFAQKSLKCGMRLTTETIVSIETMLLKKGD
jgi:hypothetical protein